MRQTSARSPAARIATTASVLVVASACSPLTSQRQITAVHDVPVILEEQRLGDEACLWFGADQEFGGTCWTRSDPTPLHLLSGTVGAERSPAIAGRAPTPVTAVRFDLEGQAAATTDIPDHGYFATEVPQTGVYEWIAKDSEGNVYVEGEIDVTPDATAGTTILPDHGSP